MLSWLPGRVVASSFQIASLRSQATACLGAGNTARDAFHATPAGGPVGDKEDVAEDLFDQPCDLGLNQG
jgi:hypothetical protein